jgi:hypothetical protein
MHSERINATCCGCNEEMVKSLIITTTGYPTQPGSKTMEAFVEFTPVVFITNLQLKYSDVKLKFPGGGSLPVPGSMVPVCSHKCPLPANKTVHWNVLEYISKFEQFLFVSITARVSLTDQDGRNLICLDVTKSSHGW